MDEDRQKVNEQDFEFGKDAARDQEIVDRLGDEGKGVDDMDDTPPHHPRAGAKAQPE